MYTRYPIIGDVSLPVTYNPIGDGSLPGTYNPPPMCDNTNPPHHLYVNNPIHVNNESPYDDGWTPKPGENVIDKGR